MSPNVGSMPYDAAGALNVDLNDLASADREELEHRVGVFGDYPRGSVGWLRARGICCDCGFQPATRVMVDPTCSPPLPYCESCIRAINDARELDDSSLLEEACPECGGGGRYDDVQACPACYGEGTVE